MISLTLLADEGKTQDAVKASQLSLLLLDTSVRDELRRLLVFMAAAAQPDACRLQKKVAYASPPYRIQLFAHAYGNVFFFFVIYVYVIIVEVYFF